MAMLTLRIYESVRHKILSGALAPGTRLIIRKLAFEHGTSDIPIREALRMLVRDGLVEMIPYRGARVVQLSATEIEEGYLIRGHLESLATRSAVGHVTSDHFKQIDRCMREMGRAIEEADGLRYAELNREFHAIIFSASPHRRLHDLINNIWDGQSAYQMVFRLSTQRLWASYQDHRRIVQALRDGDAEVAAEVALQHKLSAGQALIEALKREAESVAEQSA